MQVYVVYAPEDEKFVDRISADLRNHGFNLVAQPTNDVLQAAHSTDAIIAPLSEVSLAHQPFVEQLEFIKNSPAQFIAMRVGMIRETPDILRGILPLDFSNTDFYNESLQTLIEDLEPATSQLEPVSLLPNGIEVALSSANVDERLHAIQKLSDTRTQLNSQQLEVAERLLRDRVFKDDNGMVKESARVTLQLLSTPAIGEPPLEDDIDTLEMIATRSQPIDAMPDDNTPIIIRANQPIVDKTQLFVYSKQWWRLPIIGVVLALCTALIAERVLVALPIAFVWLVLPWFNVAIRDGGRLDWKMPGPVVGNGMIAGALSVVGTMLALIGGASIVQGIGLLISGVLFGVMIGWMSAFYFPMSNNT